MWLLTTLKLRLCRSGSTARLQLRLLLATDYPNIHHMYGIQRPTWLMARPLLWAGLFRPRQLYLQVSASLRHGSSSTLHRQSMADHLQPRHLGLGSVSDRHRG